MNSKVSYAIYLICLLWVTSCHDNGNNGIAHSLAAVESLMDSNPDSAYKLLCGYDKTKLRTERDTALFHLLWAEGRYKTFHDDTVENEIDNCVDYFQDAGDRRNLMRALFYQGKIRQNLGMQGAAMISFLESQENVDSADFLYRGKLHTALGELLGEMGDWPRQEEESRKAFECYKDLDSLVFIEDAQLWYATSLTQNNKIDQGIMLITELFEKSKERGDSELYQKAVSHLGNAYLWRKDYLNGRKYFSLLYNSPFAREMELRDKKLLLLTMLEDNATKNSVDALVLNIASDGGVVPFEYYQRIGDYKNAFNSLLNDYYELDAKYGKITKGDANFIVSNYQKDKIETAKKELTLTKERNLWIIVASGLLVVIVILVSIYLLNKKSNRINELLTLVALLSKNAKSAEKKDKADDTGVSFNVLKKIFSSLDALYSEYYKVSDGDKCRKGLLSRMGEEVEKLRSDDDMLKGFESEINKESDGLLESVYNGFDRRLNADQRRMVVFLYLNISVDALCLLLDVNVAAMYNRKTRLIKRISESTSSRKEELLARIPRH